MSKKKNKSILPLIGLTLIVSSGYSFGDSRQAERTGQVVESSIDGITLYSDQAFVRRKATAMLAAGESRIIIENLPQALIDDSTLVRFESASDLRIKEIRVETEFMKVYKSEQAKEAEELLKRAESRLRSLSDTYATLREEQTSLQQIRIGELPGENSPRSILPGRWAETLDFIQRSLERNHLRTQSVLGDIDLARENLNVALAVADRYRSATQTAKKKVLITINAPASARTGLFLEYRITGASWFPAYEGRVISSRSADTSAQLHLTAYALVRNQTGEDWKNVSMKFSAADPAVSARLPEMTSWRIQSVLTESEEESQADEERDVSTATGRGASRRAAEDRPMPAQEMNRQQYAPTRGAVVQQQPANAPERVTGGLAPGDQGYGQQQKLDRQINQSRGYFSRNSTDIQDARARQRTEESQRNLDDFRTNISTQNSAMERGDYQEALERSERVLENIRQLRPEYRRFFQDEEENAKEIKAKSMAMLETQSLIARLIPPRQSSRGFDYLYEAKLPETVNSDGAFHKVLMFEKNLDASLFYESSPIRRGLAFLAGSVTYNDETPILAGPISVFHNLDYAGEASLASIFAKESFKLNLGSDEDIAITRAEQEFRATTGLFSKSYAYDRETTITVKNRKNRRVVIDVFDRLPISSDERVKIQNTQINPTAAETRTTGIMRFHLDLGPGQEEKITIKYRLIHPEGILPVFQEGGDQW